MAPKRATRSTPVTTTPAPTAATTTTVTNAQLQAMIDQGVSAALAARDATSHTSGMGVRGSERVARECTYQDFMKCVWGQPIGALLRCSTRYQIDLEFHLSSQRETWQVFRKHFRKVSNDRYALKLLLLRLVSSLLLACTSAF
ncbi:hypothetical protein Tco_0278142 [Tanacetum coccineum]